MKTNPLAIAAIAGLALFAGTGPVIHHDLLAPDFGEALANRAGCKVGRASRRGCHDDPDRPHRIGLLT